MRNDVVLKVTVGPDLYAEFLSETEALHRAAPDVLQELIRDFVHRRQEDRAYEELVSRQAARARG